jgi:hypothetical protein
MITRGRALYALTEALRPDPDATLPAADQWPAVLKLANEQLLAPALYVELTATDRLGELPTPVADYLGLLHRLNHARNQALQRQALELIAALNAAGIEPMLLKGCLSLFAGPYADPATRMIGDIDILVPATTVADAVAALARLGYRVANQYPADHNAYGEFVRAGDPGAVDLHVEPIDASHLLSASELWRRSAAVTAAGARFHVPAANDRLLHNLLHAQIHDLGDFYRGELRLRQVHEFAVMARAFGPSVDWAGIAQRFADHRLETPLQSYLLAAQRLFGLAWPLAAAPSPNAKLHYRRCLMQLRLPLLQGPAMPWGNLRAAFAAHRMRALYGSRADLAAWLLHVRQYLRKRPVDAGIARLFRNH